MLNSKKEILAAIFGEYFDDLGFIEELNQLTYDRKVYLKKLQKDAKNKVG